MRWKNRFWVASALSLVACGSFDGIEDGRAMARAKTVVPPPAPVAETVKIGTPYQVEGQSYTPKDDVNYDEVGYASWYGEDHRGEGTGNGETYNPDAVTAAHRTLPMPSYVEVTNLATGRTILVRVNDRGPFAKNRILDLSPGAMRQLGVEGQGQIPVRVRRTNPPEYERTALKNGGQATERLPTPPGLLNALKLKLKDTPAPKDVPVVKTAQVTPAKAAKAVVKSPVPPKAPMAAKPPVTPIVKPGADFSPPGVKPTASPPTPPVLPEGDRFVVEEAGKPHWKARDEKAATTPKRADPKLAVSLPSPASGTWFVQIGAFSNAASAKAVAARSGGQVASAGAISRVRVGPYESEAAAHRALGGLRAKGYRDARVTR